MAAFSADAQTRILRAAPETAAVGLAHAELWRRFIDEHGIVLDETAIDGSYHRPTAEEWRLGKANAVGLAQAHREWLRVQRLLSRCDGWRLA